MRYFHVFLFLCEVHNIQLHPNETIYCYNLQLPQIIKYKAIIVLVLFHKLINHAPREADTMSPLTL